MNIFILDKAPIKCTRYHCDKHVIKMLLESAQMLCTVIWLHQGVAPYKPTHIKHPCVQWICQSVGNWHWLVRLSAALNEEYKYRFSHICNHKSYDVINGLSVPKLPSIGRTSFIQVMPDEYKYSTDPVSAYRKFYIAEKGYFCQWTKRKKPYWFKL